MKLRSCILVRLESRLNNSFNYPEVTIVLPAYNAQKYIKDTFKCVLSQIYKNLKIIVVDDGSTDQTLDIIKELSQNDKRVTILSKENGGLSSARNYGLTHVTSEYVTFVDSDDYIDTDYVTKLMEPFLLNDNVMISLVKYVRTSFYLANGFSNNNKIEFLKRDAGFNKCLLQYKGYDVSAWAKMYKTNLFEENKYVDGITYEDLEILPKLFSEINQDGMIAYVDSVKYQYMRTPNSIITGSFQERDLDILDIVRNGLAFVEQRLPNSREAYLAKAIAATFSVYRKAIRANGEKEDRSKIFETLKWLARQVNMRSGLTKKEIIAFLVLMLGERGSIPLVRMLSKFLKEG